MRCEEVRERFADHVNNSLAEPSNSEIERHLSACDSCRIEAEELKDIWTRLQSIPTAQPDPGMRERFDVMLEAYKQGLSHAPSQNWWQNVNSWLAGWWPRQPALQLGIALVLLVVGVWLGQANRQPPAPPAPNGEIAELRAELFETRQMVALSLMQQQSASERLKGVSWSYQLQQPGSEVATALLNTVKYDLNVNVRLAAVDALRRFGEQPAVRSGIVEALVHQESPMIQIALIDLIVDLGQKESIGTLRQLTADQSVHDAVRERAEKSIAQLE